jgi:hypothetical protein
MTARQSRTRRRAAERKARKVARKASEPCQEAGPVTENIVYPLPSFAKSRAEINRANAQHSSGPRTPEGKLASSRNSVKHGLASAQLIIPGEDPAAFDALLSALFEEHQPANPTEEILVQQMAQSYWLTQRAIRFQNQCFTPAGVDQKRLALFLRYQTTHDRAFHKALNLLIRLKKQRPVGFVSQTELRVEETPGFVSQTEGNNPAPNQFVWQTAGANGFVSHDMLASKEK